MGYAKRQEHFSAKDVNSLLKINKDKLYHWTELKGLVKPEIEKGHGRGTQTKYSFKNLLQLSLVKALYEYEFDLNRIKQIMEFKQQIIFSLSKNAKQFDIWDYFSAKRSELEREGYILVIVKDQPLVFAVNEKKFYEELYKESQEDIKTLIIKKPYTVFDLLGKIQDLEKKTGSKI